VQAVRELDHQDANVASHGHDHLPDGLGLRRLSIGHLLELGHAVHQHGDLIAEVAGQGLQAVCRVLHRVVEQGSGQRVRGHPELGQDRGHSQRMGDVRITALAELALVSLLSHGVGPLDDRQVRLWMGGPNAPQQRLQHRVGGGAPSEPREPCPDP